MNLLALIPWRYLLIGAFALSVVVGVPILWHRHNTAQQAIGYQKRAAEDAAVAEAQATRMRELQRAAELKYTVAAEKREKFIVTVTKEIHDAAAPLATCPVPVDAVRLLNSARACAGGDSPDSCGAGDPLPAAR